MVEQDYIMRLIKEIIRTIMKLLFNIDTESPTMELLEDEQAEETLKNLLHMVDDGDINEAENALSDIMENGSLQNLKIALLFYSYLNEQEEDFLEEHGFSREEIRLGIGNLVAEYGLGSVAEIFD